MFSYNSTFMLNNVTGMNMLLNTVKQFSPLYRLPEDGSNGYNNRLWNKILTYFCIIT